MNTLFIAAFTTICIHSAMAEPSSWKDELMYPVNPPRKVFLGEEGSPVTVRSLLTSSTDSIDKVAAAKHDDTRKVFSAARALICRGKNAEAVAILEDISNRLREMRRDHPEYRPMVIWELAAIVRNETRVIKTKRKRAEAETLKAVNES